jgi:hypothetical protein
MPARKSIGSRKTAKSKSPKKPIENYEHTDKQRANNTRRARASEWLR